MSIPREGSRDTGKGIIISIYPDVCYAKDKPCPFSLYAIQEEDANTAPTVRLTGQRAHNMSSMTTCSHGDEPGVAGVKSGTVGSICEPKSHSATVNIEGKPAIRHNDEWWMNCRNTVGKLCWIENTDTEEPTPPFTHENDEQRSTAAPASSGPLVMSDVHYEAQFWEPGTQLAFNDTTGQYTGQRPQTQPAPQSETTGTTRSQTPPTARNRYETRSRIGRAPGLALVLSELERAGELNRMRRLAGDLANRGIDIDWANPSHVEALRRYSDNLGGTSFIRRNFFPPMSETEALETLHGDLAAAPEVELERDDIVDPLPVPHTRTDENVSVLRQEDEPDPCEIGPYSRMSRICSQRGGQAHHIVPDFTLRTGPRPRTAAQDTQRIKDMPTLAQGMSICLAGQARVYGGEHFAAHEVTDIGIANAGIVNTALPGTAMWEDVREASLNGIEAAKPDCLPAATAAVAAQFAGVPNDRLVRAIMDHRTLSGETKTILQGGSRLVGGQVVSP